MYVVVVISTFCGDNTHPEDDNKDQERKGKKKEEKKDVTLSHARV